jgi:cyclopropane fatty-acyl-phospholipid synthase-like methyltransferase
VLDIGCGAGVTTRALVEASFEATAVEPWRIAIVATRRRRARAFGLVRALDSQLRWPWNLPTRVE